jgi:predicted nucleotidyltransferase
MMPEEIDVLKLVCNRLENDNFSYMLTGSLAANFYAVPRMTRDIDIVVEIYESDVCRFSSIFHNDFYVPNELSLIDAVNQQSMFNVIHNGSIFKVDFVVKKDSPYRREEFERRRRIDFEGMKIWIVSPEDLIISKLLWSNNGLSDFQLRDIRNLLTSVKNLDQEYIDKWIQKFELDSVYQKVKNQLIHH